MQQHFQAVLDVGLCHLKLVLFRSSNSNCPRLSSVNSLRFMVHGLNVADIMLFVLNRLANAHGVVWPAGSGKTAEDDRLVKKDA